MLVKPLPNENGVLAALTPAVYARLTPNLKMVRIEVGSTLYDIGSPSDHARFITSGIVSLLTTTEAGDIIEVAAIGREGVVGLSGIRKRNGMAFRAQAQIIISPLPYNNKPTPDNKPLPIRQISTSTDL